MSCGCGVILCIMILFEGVKIMTFDILFFRDTLQRGTYNLWQFKTYDGRKDRQMGVWMAGLKNGLTNLDLEGSISPEKIILNVAFINH